MHRQYDFKICTPIYMSQPKQLVTQKDASLKTYNTFGVDGRADMIISFRNEEDLYDILDHFNHSMKVLGGGSNILVTGNVDYLLLKNEIRGIQIIAQNDQSVTIDIGGGELWHDLVLWAVKRNYGGLENLSLIPGTVGAAPIQNIGAYGVELKDVFVSLDAVHLETTVRKEFSAADCKFGYRDSYFKTEQKEEYCITYIRLKLTKPGHHIFKLAYGDVQKTLEADGIKKPTVKAVSDAVIKIRQSKLPNPSELGNAGSFFKNPEIPTTDAEKLLAQYPDMPQFATSKPDLIKIPAGWLIEHCGWKGKRVGNTGAHAQQALVLVNYGEATGAEIWQLAQDIIASVHSSFGIELMVEVNIW